MPRCLLLLFILALSPFCHGQEPAAVAFDTLSGRRVFWRGEVVGLAIQAPMAAPTTCVIDLAVDGREPVEFYRAAFPTDGQVGRAFVQFSTARLGGGEYEAKVSLGEVGDASLRFTLRETVLPSPGMVIDDNTGLQVASIAKQAGLTAYVEYMSSAATYATYGTPKPALDAFYDRLAGNDMLHWIQDSTRPMSFSPPHSSPETDGEYTRRMVLMDAALMRYPHFAGQIFDYDPTGFTDKASHLVSYWRWGDRVDDLHAYMQGQEDALKANFTAATGMQPLTAGESLRLAAALGFPEGMGYIDLPTRTWAEQIAARSPAMADDEKAALIARAHAWYGYLMGLYGRRYEGYLAALRKLDPSLRHSTANTQGHTPLREGYDYENAYAPLDFRMISVWNDQGGNPEYPFQTPYAAMLLNQGRPKGTPMWVNTVFGIHNGHHFRNALLTAAFGGQGTGYSFEIGCSLSGQADRLVATNSPRLREIELTGKLMKRFGDLFRQAEFRPKVGVLASYSQARLRPWIQGFVDGQFKLLYLLAHANQPPMLVTEKMLAEGLPAHLEVILVQGQQFALPADAMAGLERFAANGGRVIVDSTTTVDWPFAERSAVLDLPFRDLGHPYNTGTAYNRHDGSVATLRQLAKERVPQLRALLAKQIAALPVDVDDPEAVVSVLEGGEARFAIVVNDSRLDFSELFTEEQQRTAAYQQLLTGHGEGLVTSWVPKELPLTVRVPEGGAAYSLLNRGGKPQLSADPPGEIVAIYPRPVGPGRLFLPTTATPGEAVPMRYQATDAEGNPLAAVVPVGIAINIGNDVAESRGLILFRCTDADGQLRLMLPTSLLDANKKLSIDIESLLIASSRPVGVDPAPAIEATLTLGDGFGYGLGAALQADRIPAVAVRDPVAIRRFLAENKEVVMPIFDPALKEWALHLAAKLEEQGVHVLVWENPPIETYTLGYRPTAEQLMPNQRVAAGQALGKVQFRNQKEHVNGNFYGSALTGYRLGVPVIIFGIPGQNELLDGVLASGVAWTDRSTAAPGHGLIQAIPMLLDRDADALLVTGGDEGGLVSAISALEKLPEQASVSDAVRQVRARLLAQRGLSAAETEPFPEDLSEVEMPDLGDDDKGYIPWTQLFFNWLMSPVVDVTQAGNQILVQIGRGGTSLAKVEGLGIIALPSISTQSRLHAGKSMTVNASPSLVFAYNADGEPLWRAIGRFAGFLPDSDTAVIQAQGAWYEVAPDGTSRPRAEAYQPPSKPSLIFLREQWYRLKGAELEPFVQRGLEKQPTDPPAEAVYQIEMRFLQQGNRGEPLAAEVIYLPTRRKVEGLRLTYERLPRSQASTIAEKVIVSPKKHLLLVLRRGMEGNNVQVYNPEMDRVLEDFDAWGRVADNAVFSASEDAMAMIVSGTVQVVSLDGKLIGGALAMQNRQIWPFGDGRFAVGGYGLFFWMTPDTKEVPYYDPQEFPSLLPALPAAENYNALRAVPLLTWSNPPAAPGEIPLDRFYWYLRTGEGQFGLVNWSPQRNLDFRWFDAVKAEVAFPEARKYRVTITAAAKYFDEEPMAQPSWEAFVALRQQVIGTERPPPRFRLYVNDKLAAELAPVDGRLVPFTTPKIKEGWATLKPTDDQMTTFTGDLELPAGTAMITLEAFGMTDCFATKMVIE